MRLSPAGATLLVVQIDEKNLGLIAIGQAALASSDAFPKETFAARVVYINPGIDLQRASVEVKLLAPSPPAYLRQDMTVSVDIEVSRRPSALVVPAASIIGLGTINPTALKVEGGRAVSQSVKVGLTSTGKAEIIDGLKVGDHVLSAPAGVKDGARIRARSTPARAP
jgi:HlyD family secretion protein